MKRTGKTAAARWVVILVGIAFPTVLAGQVGVETRLGTSSTSGLDGGWSWAGDLSLGRLGSSPVSPFFGIERTHNTLTEDLFFGPLEGDVRTWAGRAGLRLDPASFGRFSPFLTVALVGQNTTISLPDIPGAPEATSFDGGFEVGLDLGGGVAWSVDNKERFSLVAGLRKLLASNHDPFGLQIGVRITPGGRRPDGIASAGSYRRSDPVPIEQPTATVVDLESSPLPEERDATVVATVARDDSPPPADAVVTPAAADQSDRRQGAIDHLEEVLARIAAVRETERGLVIVLGDGLFESGASQISASGRRDVRAVAALLQQYAEYAVSLEGHADASGASEHNELLSAERARLIAEALEESGVSYRRLSYTGFGSRRPIASNGTTAGRAQNRRVEVIIQGAERPRLE